MRLASILLLLAACGGSPDPAGPDGDGGGGGDGGGSSQPDDRLDPLAVGRTWTYDVTSTYTSCPAGQHDQRVTATSTTDGRPTLHVASFCGTDGETSATGDVVENWYDWGPTGWYRQLDEPVSDGHTWTTTNGSATFTQTYHSTTVAGYTDCWDVIQNVSYTSHWIYCRGTGLVRYEMIDLAGGTITATLRSKDF